MIKLILFSLILNAQTTTTTTLVPSGFAAKFIDLCGKDISSLPEPAKTKAQEAKTKAGCP